ncbi:transcription termination/antitermination NusG family protein [Mesorhizobium sp. KR9-304]|uniref:transcription termination/antitermination NusG family protein n=1 Tax=Mesorhizobium sp. KR9-304 TaxID=3156614 RepID=UPI0032B59A04
MMRVDRKQLSEAETIVGDRQTARLDAARAVSRRQQALLAGANQVAPDQDWFVLLVAEGLDIVVDNLLTNERIEHWMPALKLERKRRYGRRRPGFEPLVSPALPGYMFAKVVPSAETWAGLKMLDGVVGPLGGAACPSPVKAKEITKLKAFIEGDAKAVEILTNALRAGDRVAVDNGPFGGFEGIVSLLSGKGRLEVEVDIFGRSTPVDLELAQVTKLD